MKKALRSLLNAIGRIADRFEEVTDTEVRERMRAAIERSVIGPKKGYVLPDAFGMFSPQGDAKVKAALAKFIEAARLEAQQTGLSTRKQRLLAFQDLAVES